MVTLWTLDRGSCSQVPQIIGVLQAPAAPTSTGGNRGRGNVFVIVLPQVTLLNVMELRE